MDITFRQLEYFIALAETRHFGRAAARVHVSQPALSVQIREMEERLGAVLIERQPRGIVLTPVGHDVLRHARRVRAEMRALGEAARLRDGMEGRLALGVIPTVAPYLLPESVPMLRRKWPRLDLRIRETRTEGLLAALREGTLDAAVIALPAGVPGVVEAPLFEDRFLLAGARAQVEALATAPEALRPGALDPEQLLLLEEGHCLADQALEVCALERGDTRMDLSASSLGTLCRLAADGFGLTFLPEIALAAESRALPGMATCHFAPPEPARTIGLVRRASTPGGKWFPALVETLAEAGRELLGTARSGAEGRASPPG